MKLGIVLAIGLTATSLQAAPRASSQVDPNKVTCKRFEVTGSLAKVKRVCKTNREWMLLQEAAREDGEATTKNVCSGEGTCAG